MTDRRELSHSDYRSLSALRFQIRRFLHFSEAAAKAEGLEPQQHQMLLAIRGLEEPDAPPTVGDLADHLLVRHHSAVGLLDRLVVRGLVERVRGADDRRQVRVRLTEEGSHALGRLARIHREELRQSGPALVEILRNLLEQTA